MIPNHPPIFVEVPVPPMKKNSKTKEQLLAENEDLRRRLEEAEETLRAIHEGEVDALVISKPEGEVVFTLKGAEHPYRVFVEAMNEGGATLDPDGTILYCNKRFAEMLKTPAERVIGSSVYRFIPATDRSDFESAFQEGKQRDTTADISFKREDQGLIPAHVSFNLLHGQEMPVVCMIAMDLTERKRLEDALHQLNADLEKRVQERTAELVKVNETLRAQIVERQRAEESLQESQALLRSVFETTPDLIFVKDRQSRIMMANAATLRLIGKPIEEVIRKDDRQHYDDPAVGEAIMANDRRIMESGQTEVIEEIAQRPEGYRVYLSTKTPYRNSDGEIIGILGVARDITERKQAEEELQRYRNELELRVMERTRELKSINEDLKTENEERLEVEIELRESESRLRELSSELLNAQEKERRLVAQEIHDSIGSSLAAIKWKVEGAFKEVGENNPQIRSALEGILPMLQETIQETRRIQMNLRPPMLDDLGILATISWFCRQYESIYSAIRIRQAINIKEEEVADYLKTVIFRVLQEALNNIAKHSKASEVLLQISKIDRDIQLVIGDNGQGFNPSETHSRTGRIRGRGLVGMQERVELSGGSFALESGIGKGTVIRASWPASAQDR